MVAIVADVVDSVEGLKQFNPAAGSIESLPAWRMWNEEVVAMGRKVGRGGAASAHGVARRVSLAAQAIRALQVEIAKCPPVAREVIGCRDLLLGIAHAIALDDAECLKESCEVVIMCAQECGSRAGDAIVSCPKLLNGMCRKAMQTEDPSVVDALTALSHQNDKMLWIVTTIIKVMRVEQKCEVGLLRRSFRLWTLFVRAKEVKASKQNSPSPTKSTAPPPAPSSQKMCDVDDYYLQTISARSYLHQGQVVPSSKANKGTQRIRDDIVIEPSVHSATSTMQSSIMTSSSIKSEVLSRVIGPQPSGLLYSSWNASTPLYSTWNGNSEMPSKELSNVQNFGLVPEEGKSQPNSTSSSLSLPSTTGESSTFGSVKMSKEADHNLESMMSLTERLMYRSQQLNSEVDGLRSTRALPEARFLPQKDWVASQAPQSETSFVPLTVPPDSMLFASHTTNTIPQPPASFAWKGAEFFVPPVDPREAPISAMSVYARPAPVHIVEHLRTQAVRPATVQYGRTPSAPPRMTVTEQPQWSMESARSSSVTRGDNASRARALSPPRILPSIKYVEPAGAGIQREEVRGSHTIQVPVHKAAPGSVCDVDELYGYFSRGRSKTRRPEASGVAQPSSAPVQVSRAQMPSSGPSQASFASTSPLRSSSPTLSSSHIGSQRALEVANQTIMAAPRSRSPIRRPESPARSPSAPRVDHRQFHKMADEIAFQHIGVGAMMVRNQSPMRSSSPNGRPVSPPATRSVLASPTSIPIQFANKRSVESPQTAPTMTLDVSPQTESMMTRDVSPLRGPQVTANDWVGAAVTYAPSFNYSQSGMVYVPGVASPVNAHFNRVFVPDVSADDDDDWC